MLIRKTVLALALAGAAMSAALADTGSTWVGGELGIETHSVQNTKSRAEVQNEYFAFRSDPISADGGRVVGGEAGYVPPQHSYAFQGGRLVRTDRTAHNTPKPSLAMSAAERRAFRDQYTN